MPRKQRYKTRISVGNRKLLDISSFMSGSEHSFTRWREICFSHFRDLQVQVRTPARILFKRNKTGLLRTWNENFTREAFRPM